MPLARNGAVIYDVDDAALSGADGAAAPASALQIAGNDGTNLQVLTTDSSGRQQMVGAAADGAAEAGNPVLMGGSDGTNARTLATDTSGRPTVVGAVADGASATGVNPVIVAGVDGAGDVQQLNVDTNGNLQVSSSPTPAATPTTTNVASSATNVTLLAANASRLGATIVNDGNAVLYVKFGATASTTSFTVKIPANGYYEVPFQYVGIIDGIWSVANGSARVTELTA